MHRYINRSPNLSLTIRPSESQQKNRNCRKVKFTVLAEHRVKFKKNEKRNKYLDHAREI